MHVEGRGRLCIEELSVHDYVEELFSVWELDSKGSTWKRFSAELSMFLSDAERPKP